MLEFRNIGKNFITEGTSLSVIKDINLSIQQGEFVAIAGPSGCGKSTLLRLIAGLDFSDQGEILIGERNILGVGHRLGYVFQESALLPWRTLAQNVALGLETQGVPAATRRAQAVGLLEMFGLKGFEDFFPHMVSGGMKARVAIARAYIIDPTLLLMDEPFVALDAQTRETLQHDLSHHWQKNKKTILFVTHSLEEALLLGTRVVVLGKRPSTIIADYPVDFAFPRDPATVEFVSLRKKLRSHLL